MKMYKNLEDIINLILLNINFNSKLNYKNKLYKIYPIIVREYYSLLSKDKEMNKLIKKKNNIFFLNYWILEYFVKKKKFLYIKTFKYYLNLILNFTEIPFFFYFLIKNFFKKNKIFKADIVCFVRERKHYNYIKNIFKNESLKIKFLVISNRHQERINSFNFETIYLKNIKFNQLNLFLAKFSKYKFFIKI